jgi:hypothetical protein
VRTGCVVLAAIVGSLILTIVLIDRFLVPEPPDHSVGASALAQLSAHDVKRVTIRAVEILVEHNDGKQVLMQIPAETDLGPAVMHSGAEVSVVPAVTAVGATRVVATILQIIPGLILLTIIGGTITARNLLAKHGVSR